MKHVCHYFFVGVVLLCIAGTASANLLTFHTDKVQVSPGDTVTYDITARAPGGKPCNAQINFGVPAGMTFVRDSISGVANGGSQSFSCTGSACTWRINHFHQNNGHLKLTLRVNNGIVTPPLAPAISGSCGLGTGTYVAPGPGHTVTGGGALTFATQPELTIAKTTSSPSHVVSGDLVDYSIEVHNRGTGDATAVSLVDTIPANTEYVSHAGGTPLNVVNPAAGNDVEWNLGTISPGQTLAATLKLRVVSGSGTIDNVATATSGNGAGPVSAMAPQIVIDSVPFLDITKSVDKVHFNAGDLVTYKIDYANTGSASATNVMVTDALPSGLTYVSSTPSGNDIGGTVSWSFASVPAGQGGQIVLKALIDPTAAIGDEFDNTATIVSNQTTQVDSNEITVDVVGGVPVLLFDKTVDRASASAGEQLTYTLTYQNVGAATSTGAVMTDTLPAGVTFVSASGGGMESGGVVTWNLPAVGPGQRGSEFVNVQINPGVTSGPVTNKGGISSPGAFQGLVTGQSTTNTRAAPVLTLSKTIDKPNAEAGETVRYTLSYENTGTVTATGVTITDDVDGQLLLPASIPNATISGQRVEWNLGDLPPHATGSVTFDATVVGGAVTGTVIGNQALIEAVNANSATANVSFTVQNAPELIVSKLASPTSVRPGEEINFVILYANIGTAAATSVVIEDILPTTSADLVAVPTGAVQQGDRLIWNIASVPPGNQVYNLSFRMRAKSSAQDGDVISNAVSITSTELPNGKTSSVDVDVVNAILQVSKTVSQAQATPGNTLDYTITVQNLGHTSANSLVLEDHLPPFTNFTSASNGGSESGGIVTWSLGTLAAGASASVTAKVQLDGAIPNGTVLNNIVHARSTGASAVSPNVPVKITSAPDLTISKQVQPTSAKPGETVVYTITYGNAGTDTATEVLLVDQFPADLDFVSATNGITPVGGLLTWDLKDVATGVSGTLTVTGTVKGSVADGANITNTSTIGETQPPSTVQLNPKSSSATFTASNLPRLSIAKNLVSTSLQAGQEAVYRISIANQGTAPATQVMVEDILPGELTFVSASGAQPAIAGQTLTWSFPSLAPGANTDIDYRVQVASPIRDGLLVTNTATLTSAQTGPTGASASATVSSQPQLTIVKTASAPTVEPGPPGGNPGGTIVYTITYENVGTDTATGVTLEDHLPAGVSFVSASNGGTESASVVSWSLPDFPAGQGPRTVTLTVQADSVDTLKDGTKLHNTASVTSNQTGPASTFVDVLASGEPRLTLVKTAPVTIVDAGQEITYTLTYQNVGTADADFVRVEDQLPPSGLLAYVSNTGGGTPSGNAVTWNLGAVAAGQSGSLTVTARVADVISDGTLLANLASVANYQTNAYTSFALPPVLAFNLVSVNSAAALAISKTASASLVQAGADVSYTIQYENTGHDVATGLVLTDQLPSGLTFVSASGSGAHANGLVTWQLPDLPAKSSGSVILTARVDTPIADGTQLLNTATITANQVLPVNSAPVSITAASAPVLSVDKVASAPVVNAGGTVSYSLTYRNTGTDQATNVVVEDNLPAEMTLVSASPTAAGPADTSGVNVSGGGVVRWNVGTVPPGVSGSLTLVGQVPNVIANGTGLFNSASISSTRTTGTSVLSRVDVNSAPILSLSKTSATSVASPAADITYTIQYENTGSDTATGVTLLDTLPANTSFLAASDGGMETAPGVVGWPMPNIAANTSGSVTVTVTTDPVISNGTILTNVATLDSLETGPASATLPLPVSSAPQLALTERTSQASFVAAGAQVLYTLTYENVGNDIANNLTITDIYPSAAFPIVIDSAGSFDNLNSQAVWHLSSLAPGQQVTVQYTLMVPIGTPVGSSWNTASSVTATNAAPAAAQTTLIVDSQPDLQLTKTGSNSVEAGQQASYLIEYFNAGNGTASAFTIQDIVPPGWSLASASNGGAVNGGNVVWNLGDLPPLSGGSVTVVFDTALSLPDGAVATNTASAFGTNAPAVSALATTVERSHVELDVNIFGSPNPVSAGGQVSFTLFYENLGNANSAAVSVTATVPPNTTVVPGSISAGGVLSSGTITWGPLPLAAVTGGQASFQVDVDPVVANGTQLVSNASISAPDALTDTDSTSVTVSSAPILVTSKKVDMQEVLPGDVVTYTITVENIGTENAANVMIADQLPASLELLTAEPNGVVDSGTNTATWTIAALDVGQPAVEVTATAMVLAANADIINVATVATATGPGQQITNPRSNVRSGPAEPEVIPVMPWVFYALLLSLLTLIAHGALTMRRR